MFVFNKTLSSHLIKWNLEIMKKPSTFIAYRLSFVSVGLGLIAIAIAIVMGVVPIK